MDLQAERSNSRITEMSTGVLVVLSTFGDMESAREAARTAVEEQLAACGNIIPQIESIYRWKGKVESNPEVLVVFKTTRECYPQLEQCIRAHHPYELPEIIALEVDSGLHGYLNWVVESVS